MSSRTILIKCLFFALTVQLITSTTQAARSERPATNSGYPGVVYPESICLKQPKKALQYPQRIENLEIMARKAKASAWSYARKRGWKVKGSTNGQSFELMAIEKGRPVYKITNNANAAISSGANVLGGVPFFIDGNDVTIGIWDAGWVLDTHQEFAGRVTIKDSNSLFNDHATLVAGTIGASGIDPCAMGMAPAVNIDSYDWTNDIAEMAGRAATSPNEPGKIYLSNHSYGLITGWQYGRFIKIPGDFTDDGRVDYDDLSMLALHWLDFEPSIDIAPGSNGDGVVNLLDYAAMAKNWLRDTNGYYWFGVWSEREDRYFGWYGSWIGNWGLGAHVWDSICYSAPYYLPFKSVGNDRDDDAPPNGTQFWYFDPNNSGTPHEPNDPNNWSWIQGIYDNVNDANAPYDDGWDNGGFDTITGISTAKNIMTVGAVDDAVDFSGRRDPNKAAMAVFSGWGPTDDGRIKPDIVANGVGLYSPIAVGDVNYATYSSTSMASASAAGSVALLVEYYNRLFSGRAMLASTLKGLIIHTATDLGNAGPDYKYGWGLIDVNEAAHYIKQDFEEPNSRRIIEDVLVTGINNTYEFTSDSNSPIRATLCWIDPPGPNIAGLDNNTPCLVNDLDLCIIDTNNLTIHYPYILSPDEPNAPAITGDNKLDNVEQVYIPDANAGTYVARISCKGALTDNLQNYSLILSPPYEPNDSNVNICGSALQFDGANDYVDCGKDSSLDITDAMTVTAWVKPQGSSILAAQRFIARGYYNNSSDNKSLNLWYDYDSSEFGYRIRHDGNEKIIKYPGVNGVWQHIVATYDSGTMKLYIDGEYVDEISGADLQSDISNYNLMIGAWVKEPLSHYFNGTIDEVVIYDRALTAEEVHEIYCNGVFVDSNTVGYWDFDEGEGQVAHDSSGNGNDGRLGATTGLDTSDPVWVVSDVPFPAIYYVDDDGPDDPTHGLPGEFIAEPGLSDPNEDGTCKHPFDSIQKAINYAIDNYCDCNCAPSICVHDGIYTGIGNNNIDTHGLAITIKSLNGPNKCIINCQDQARGFIFQTGEDANTVLDGLAITGGYSNQHAGAIYCNASSPAIRNCVISASHSVRNGGAIYCYGNSTPIITGCTITGNYAGWSGGGIWLEDYSNAKITNCTITDNECEGGGVAIDSYNSNPTIANCTIAGNRGYWSGAITSEDDSNSIVINCTIADNIASSGPGGLECYYGNAVVINSILWNNTDEQILEDGGSATVTYSDIQVADGNDWPGEGNINDDPLFANTELGDYHLKSTAGRWSPMFGTWLFDEQTSPGIDAGKPSYDYSQELCPNGGRINMGAYGNTEQASKSP